MGVRLTAVPAEKEQMICRPCLLSGVAYRQRQTWLRKFSNLLCEIKYESEDAPQTATWCMARWSVAASPNDVLQVVLRSPGLGLFSDSPPQKTKKMGQLDPDV